MPALLTADEICAALEDMPGWQVEDGVLVKTFVFATYLDGIAFVNRLAARAEAANHHPDVKVGWRRVEVRFTTHSAGGITALDVGLVREADACVESGEIAI